MSTNELGTRPTLIRRPITDAERDEIAARLEREVALRGIRRRRFNEGAVSVAQLIGVTISTSIVLDLLQYYWHW